MTKISFVGDIMCTVELNNSILKTHGAYDYTVVFEDIRDIFKDSDYVVGNLETPLAGEDLEYSYKKWSFNSPTEFGKAVKWAGFNLVTTANNHSLDRGAEGLRRTMESLEGIGLDYTGSRKTSNEHPWKVVSFSGINIGFLSYTYGTNAAYNEHYLLKGQQYLINLFQQQERLLRRHQLGRRFVRWIGDRVFWLRHPIQVYMMSRAVKDCRNRGDADFVVMCLHIGGQRNDMPESFTRWMSNALINAGADAVISSHEHVIHPVQFGPNRRIEAFSLGNFLHHPDSESEHSEVKNRLRGDYSIVLHLYLEKGQNGPLASKLTFSITKNIIDDNGIGKVTPIADLHKNLNQEQKHELEADALYIINKVVGQNLNKIEIVDEYPIEERP